MRKKSPERIDQIIKAIEHLKLSEGKEPTIPEISKATGLSYSRIHSYLTEMNEKGIITYGNRHYDTPKTEMTDFTGNVAPVVGSVKCGDPQLEEAEILEYVKLPAAIFGKSAMYILTARGDSMEDAGIAEGDYVVVENTVDHQKNDIVVAMDEDGANTLKRYKGKDKSGKARLAYENESVYPGKEIKLDQMRIQGVARFVIKKL